MVIELLPHEVLLLDISLVSYYVKTFLGFEDQSCISKLPLFVAQSHHLALHVWHVWADCHFRSHVVENRRILPFEENLMLLHKIDIILLRIVNLASPSFALIQLCRRISFSFNITVLINRWILTIFTLFTREELIPFVLFTFEPLSLIFNFAVVLIILSLE